MTKSLMPRGGAGWKVQVCVLTIACGLSVPVNAATIAVTYSLAGATTGTPVASGTTLTFDSLSTVSLHSDNGAQDAVWNPVTATDHNVVDFATGLNNATFSWTFADGDKLFGTLLENVSQLDGTGSGPFTQTFTFNGGTGAFAQVTGSLSGAGVGTASGFTSTGSGVINASEVPEPGAAALFLGGSTALLLAFRRSRAIGQI